jgi:hypothetical protein
MGSNVGNAIAFFEKSMGAELITIQCMALPWRELYQNVAARRACYPLDVRNMLPRKPVGVARISFARITDIHVSESPLQ